MYKSVILALLMLIASATAFHLTPKAILDEASARIDINKAIPTEFGEWRLEQTSTSSVVNPQVAELIEKFYSQTVSRIYIGPNNYRIMLSIAYGDDQSRSTQLHKPETCYPAQGFELKFSRPATLHTSFGTFEATQLYASNGNRMEPVTYWMRVGDSVVRGGLPQTYQRIKIGILNKVLPDGLIFRVSNISSEPNSAFIRQEKFIDEFLNASSPKFRRMLIGK